MGEPLDVQATELGRKDIQTEEQATQFVLELVDEMVKWRQQCDVQIPDPTAVQVQMQRRALWTFLTKQGQVVGALKAFKASGLLSDRAFVELNQRAINTLVPSQVGAVG